MKLIIIILISFSFNAKASFKDFNPAELISNGALFKDAADIVAQIGLNCATDPRFIPIFVKEFWRIVSGVTRVATESAQMMLYKHDYPTLCHVMTQSHLDSYTEGIEVKKEKKCSLKNPLNGKCLAHKLITKERPKPSYYWPLYFIEVTEKGNDPHSNFAQGNLLYSANRKIAKILEKFIDQAGAVKLTALVMGGSNALSSVGMKVDKSDISELSKIAALTPFEKLRIRASKKDDQRSFDAAIWPVAMGELMARHFSVCGPIRELKGQRPGGYSWSFKGVPMTCPVAMTNDAYAFWDTGMIDYLDPEALSAMAIGSNPLTCGLAQGAAALSGLGYTKGNSVGGKEQINKQLSGLGGIMKQSLNSCSFPLLGAAHGIAKQALSLTDPGKWKQAKCTLWGSVAPRMSTSVYETDYSYANTALKFKMLSHDLFSLPRGKEERWSLAYPWEGSSSFLSGKFSDYFSELDKLLRNLGISLPKTSNRGRSYSLFTPGSPYLIDMSVTPKHLINVTTNWAKEISYLTGLTAASAIARDQMERQFETTHNQTIPLKNEVIWKKKAWCKWSGHKVNVSNERECFGQSHNHNHHIKYIEEMYKAGTRKVPSPVVRKYKTVCGGTFREPYRSGCRHPRTRCTTRVIKEHRIPADTVRMPTKNPTTITSRTETQQILSNAAAATPWIAAEIARNSLSEMTGYNPIKGDQRIFTIWEKIDCVYPSTRITTKIGVLPKVKKYDSCESAIRYEVYKYVQTKFLRKICNAFGQKEGRPWK
jgi:hypothetical protein